MIKRFLGYASLVAVAVVTAVSCSKAKSYADYVNEQNSAIKDYVSRNNIELVYTLPEGDGEWLTADGKPIYYVDYYGMYYHQIEKGDGQLEPKTGYSATVRYIGKDMSGSVIYDHSSKVMADPVSFTINQNPSGSTFGVGFQNAVRNMRGGGHCLAIIPFTIGNGTDKMVSGVAGNDMGSYRPMEYEIWLANVE